MKTYAEKNAAICITASVPFAASQIEEALYAY